MRGDGLSKTDVFKEMEHIELTEGGQLNRSRESLKGFLDILCHTTKNTKNCCCFFFFSNGLLESNKFI